MQPGPNVEVCWSLEREPPAAAAVVVVTVGTGNYAEIAVDRLPLILEARIPAKSIDRAIDLRTDAKHSVSSLLCPRIEPSAPEIIVIHALVKLICGLSKILCKTLELIAVVTGIATKYGAEDPDVSVAIVVGIAIHLTFKVATAVFQPLGNTFEIAVVRTLAVAPVGIVATVIAAPLG